MKATRFPSGDTDGLQQFPFSGQTGRASPPFVEITQTRVPTWAPGVPPGVNRTPSAISLSGLRAGGE